MHSPAWDAWFQLLQWDRQPSLDGRRCIGYELLQRGKSDAYKAHDATPGGSHLTPQTRKAERIALQAACQDSDGNYQQSAINSLGRPVAWAHIRLAS